MARPSTRQEFIDYVLRGLGAPVIDINVSESQVEDRVDEALQYYQEYHFDGSTKTYYKHQITSEDLTNGWIPIDEKIIYVVGIFPVMNSFTGSDGMFSLSYQIALNDLYSLTTPQMTPYVLTRMQLEHIQEILVGKQQIRFNRRQNKIHLDFNLNKLGVGRWLMFEAYTITDPDEYDDVWGDRWLYRYASALVKKQWGMNISKFDNVQLPGGVTFNGRLILDDAIAEVSALEDEMMISYSYPPDDQIG